MTLKERIEHCLATTSAGNIFESTLCKGQEEGGIFLLGLACGLAAPHEGPITAAEQVLSQRRRR